jgi:hypothetical protein
MHQVVAHPWRGIRGLFNSQTAKPFSYADACVEFGLTVAYNAQAVADAQKAVREITTALAASK